MSAYDIRPAATAASLATAIIKKTSWKLYLIIFLVAIVIAGSGIGVYYGLIRPTLNAVKNISTYSNYSRIKNAQDLANMTMTNKITTTRSSLLSNLKDIPENQRVLANFSVLTAYNVGYAGPFQSGVYSELITTQLTVQQGVRGFFLNIDADKTWAPFLVSRDVNGYRTNIDSYKMKGNQAIPVLGGDPEIVLQTIANSVFSNSLGHVANDPVIIYLHFDKTPDPVKMKSDYIAFLAKIARMLMPFRQNHLRMTPRGDFTRQRSAETIHLNPITEYEKKVLIYSNVDTSVFREKAYPENQDLDYWVHLRLYTNSGKSLGATEKIKDSTLIRGQIENLQHYRQTPPDRIGDVVADTKISFNISLSQTPSVDLSGATTALDTFGAQMVPIDIFNPANKPVLDLYKKSAFRIKPSAIRYTIPAPIVIAPQNPKMNSNQGLIMSPSPPVAAGAIGTGLRK